MHYGAVRRRARAGGGSECVGDVTWVSSGRKLERGGEVAASTAGARSHLSNCSGKNPHNPTFTFHCSETHGSTPSGTTRAPARQRHGKGCHRPHRRPRADAPGHIRLSCRHRIRNLLWVLFGHRRWRCWRQRNARKGWCRWHAVELAEWPVCGVRRRHLHRHSWGRRLIFLGQHFW